LVEPVTALAASESFVLKFRQDSWVQVKTEAGTILSSHLAKAGTEEAFSVKQVLYVKLGNAAGVDAILRGSPMTVTSERGNNVANLVVK
jgi:cytoskeleton protein RodZ